MYVLRKQNKFKTWFFIKLFSKNQTLFRGRCGHDHMVVGFSTSYAISAYHHWSSKFESRTWLGVLDITFGDKVDQWHAAGLWFSPGTLVSFTNKTDSHDIIEILLKVALNTMTLILKHHSTNVGFLITGTMLMEILRERKIIIQRKIKVQIIIRKIINANNMNSYKTLYIILMNIYHYKCVQQQSINHKNYKQA
jgi:hypothetical protein